MTLKTMYFGVYGTAEELRNLEWDEKDSLVLPPTRGGDYGLEAELQRLNRSSKLSPLIVPHFMGILQLRTVTDGQNPEITEKELREAMEKNLVEYNGASVTTAIADVNVEDDFNPALIHLVYSRSLGLSKETMRIAMPNIPRRIVISPACEVPRFYEKDPDVITRLYEHITDLTREGKKSKEVTRLIIPETDQLTNQTQRYGATSPEYKTQKTFEKARRIIGV